MRLLATCALAALIAATVAVGNAVACSCVGEDPEVRLKRADAAVVGTVIEVKRLEGNEVGGRWEYTLRVEEDYKRDLGPTEVVRSRGESPTCGLELSVGDRLGLFLYGDEPWEVGLCHTFDPAELRSSTKPLPRPREGRVAFLAGGFGVDSSRLVGLDRRGRTVAYGRGPGTTLAVAACPGGRRAVEFVLHEGRKRPHSLEVRRLDTFRVERRVRLGIGESDHVAGLECADRRARTAYLVSSTYDGGVRSRLVRMRGTRARTIARGRSQTVAFGDDVAYVDHEGRELRVIDLSDGSSKTTARNLAGLLHLSLSPDRASLAMVLDGQSGESLPGYGDTELVVVDIASEHVLTHRARIDEAGSHGGTVWLDPSRLFYYPTCCGNGGRLFDSEANELARIEWRAGEAVAVEGLLYGAAGDLLYVSEPPADGRRLRTLFGNLTSPLEPVPGRPRVRASRACASVAW